MHLTEEDYEILHGIRPGRVAASIANLAARADERDAHLFRRFAYLPAVKTSGRMAALAYQGACVSGSFI